MADLADLAVCGCRVWPVVLWRVPGHGWVVGATVDLQADPVADAERYADLGADQWVTFCPECGMLFAAGEGVIYPA